MKYLQLIRVAPGAQPEPSDTDPGPWVEETTAHGTRITGERLRPPQDATTVRSRGHETIVTDGPFAEAREQIGGFDILEADDMDAAIAVAAAHPVARFGSLELREIWPFGVDDLDASSPGDVLAVAPPAGWHRYLMIFGADEETERILAGEGNDEDTSGADGGAMDWQAVLTAWVENGARRGTDVDGGRLRPPEETKTVRVREGRTLVVDGPFAEAREHVAGYNIIQAPSLDEAIEIAATHPGSHIGPIELRPLWPM
ncbi:MAG: YciI family protein [Cellulomonas sp.]